MGLAVTEQEIAITKYRDENEFDISVSDRTLINLLRRRGHEPYADDGTYCRFKLPAKCLTFRRTPKNVQPQQEKRLQELRGYLEKARAARKAKTAP